jgi:hypothetical protein
MMVIKILCGGFVIAVLMAMVFDAYSDLYASAPPRTYLEGHQ